MEIELSSDGYWHVVFRPFSTYTLTLSPLGSQNRSAFCNMKLDVIHQWGIEDWKSTSTMFAETWICVQLQLQVYTSRRVHFDWAQLKQSFLCLVPGSRQIDYLVSFSFSMAAGETSNRPGECCFFQSATYAQPCMACPSIASLPIKRIVVNTMNWFASVFG